MTSPPDYYGWIFQFSRTDIGGATVLYPMTLTAGGSFFNRHGDVAFDSEPVRAATDFLVEITRKAGGPGVFNYNINENFNLVNSGKTSMTMDAAAIVAVAAREAPAVADQLDAVAIPHRNQVASLLQGGSLMVVKGKNKNPADARNFAKYLLQPANHVEFLHTIPLFMFPTTVGASGPEFYEHPTIQRFKNVAEVSIEALKVATLFGSDDGINPFASPVLNARIVEDMFARIVLNNTPVPEAVKLAHDQMADLTGALKRRLRL